MNYNRRHYRNHFRRRRFARFIRLVDEIIAHKGKCHIADVGGRWEPWEAFKDELIPRNVRITVLDLEKHEFSDTRFDSVVVDARDMAGIDDNSFDVVHSNSVIEHVGRWPDQKRMAREICRIAPRHFVQTPNFWFPIEPHYRLPFIHWMPEIVRLKMVQTSKCGFYQKAANVDEAYSIIEDARLLDAQSMAALFPQSKIVRERFGVTKSLLAIR
ncbi:class I SAM-dependent methyltransferase [Bradyrhizobium sp. PMVTL-01]|uniref:class I SAM-dependent methyltransferase n=1 Tax=Bradyrhizobium sp. PMVTL-01 TaxID=3434999 RepID=UPI003F70262E